MTTMSVNFEKWDFDYIIFTYKPSCNVLTSGSMMLAFDPNPEDATPTTF